jgi:hypothetical protein
MLSIHRLLVLSALVLLAASGLAAGEEGAAGLDARAAFDKLKALAGDWYATSDAMPGERGDHRIRVSAGGSVVMETMMAGTDYEMINMYHLDGDDLVLTHYCAGGNQPTMRLDRAKATATELPFVFTGGTNLDPATDQHIHDTVITLRDDGSVVAHWSSYSAGEKGEDLVITLRRAEG